MDVVWIDILALVFSAAALVFSFWQFKIETQRYRKEATIHAFDDLEKNEAVLFLFEVNEQEIGALVRWKLNSNNKSDPRCKKAEEWESISRALPLIEHFAVGINSNVYDLRTLNSMAGNQLIRTWNNCEELIGYKRNGEGKQKNYDEFEKMVKALVKVRDKNK